MADTISYPTGDIAAVAKELRTFLEEQLAQHHKLFYQQPSSYHDLTIGLAQNIPQAGGSASALTSTVEEVHTDIVHCYDELFRLLDTLERGDVAMEQTDNEVQQGFDHLSTYE